MNTDDLSAGSILLGCPDAADSPGFSRSFVALLQAVSVYYLVDRYSFVTINYYFFFRKF